MAQLRKQAGLPEMELDGLPSALAPKMWPLGLKSFLSSNPLASTHLPNAKQKGVRPLLKAMPVEEDRKAAAIPELVPGDRQPDGHTGKALCLT